MTIPEGDVTQKRVNNRFSLVVLAAKRAKQLKEGAPALIEATSANCLTVALDEIVAGKVTYTEAVDEAEGVGGDIPGEQAEKDADLTADDEEGSDSELGASLSEDEDPDSASSASKE